MNHRRTNTFGLVVCSLFVATFSLLIACRPVTIEDSWHVVTVRGDRAFLCTSNAIGTSLPPSCGAQPGTEHNLPLTGELVGDLIAELGPLRSQAIITATRVGDRWQLEAYEL